MDILDILLDILLKPPQPFIGLFFYHQLDNINIIKQWKKNKEYSNNWYENNDVLKSDGHQRFNGRWCPRTPANSKSLVS